MVIVQINSTTTAKAGSASSNSSNSSSKNGNRKRIPLGKLALVLLFGCLYAAGTNFVFSSFLEHGPKDRSEHYQPSAIFRAAQKKVAEANRNKGNNTNKKSNIDNKPAHNNKRNNDDGSTYTCSYKAARDNRITRTTVVAPKNIPSFIVAGVQKSGSTALLTYFRDHPQMLQTKHSFRREAHFFDTSWNSKVVNEAHELGLKQANDKHCLALEQYMKLFETETILANSQTMAHEQQEEKEEPPQPQQQHGEQQQQQQPPPPRHHPLYTFEKTPSYFGNSKIPERIKQTVPWSKIVVILRNPVDRIYSQYKMTVLTNYNLRKYSIEDMVHHELMAMKKFNMTRAPMFVPVFGESNNDSSSSKNNDDDDPYRHLNATSYRIPEHVPFDHAVHDSGNWSPPHRAIIKKPDAGVFETENLVRRGLYSTQLKWWLKRYTAGEDLLVVNYKDLVEDTRSVYERVLGFAGIPLPANTSAIDFDKRARTDKRKEDRPLAAETRRYLEEFYAPHNAELEELLGEEWSPEKLGW